MQFVRFQIPVRIGTFDCTVCSLDIDLVVVDKIDTICCPLCLVRFQFVGRVIQCPFTGIQIQIAFVGRILIAKALDEYIPDDFRFIFFLSEYSVVFSPVIRVWSSVLFRLHSPDKDHAPAVRLSVPPGEWSGASLFSICCGRLFLAFPSVVGAASKRRPENVASNENRTQDGKDAKKRLMKKA